MMQVSFIYAEVPPHFRSTNGVAGEKVGTTINEKEGAKPEVFVRSILLLFQIHASCIQFRFKHSEHTHICVRQNINEETRTF